MSSEGADGLDRDSDGLGTNANFCLVRVLWIMLGTFQSSVILALCMISPHMQCAELYTGLIFPMISAAPREIRVQVGLRKHWKLLQLVVENSESLCNFFGKRKQ